MVRRRGCLAAAVLAAAVATCGACAPTGRPAGTGTEPPATPSAPATVVPGTPDAAASEAGSSGTTDPSLDALASQAEELATRLATPAPGGPVLGADVSWPQCPEGMGIPERRTLGKPMPLPTARYVVIGLTNGPAFTRNPCLADQVTWARERGLAVAAYSVLSFPSAAQLRAHGRSGPYDGSSRLGALRNVGHRQALVNVEALRAAGLVTPIVWLDVEPVPDFDWSSDPQANAAVVEGAARGYRDAGYRIGVYSTPYLWEQIVGGLRLGVPEWRAAGETSMQEALSRCGEDWSIQGGQPVMGQWVADDRDHNVTCPGVDLAPWFHGAGR